MSLWPLAATQLYTLKHNTQIAFYKKNRDKGRINNPYPG